MNQKPFRGWSQLWSYLKWNINKDTLWVLGLCVFPNCRDSLKSFVEIYKAQYGNAMLVHQYGGKYCKHLELTWLSRRLIIRSSYPNAPTSKKAKNHEIYEV